MAELSYSDPITAGVLVDTMNSFEKIFYNNFNEHYGPILERLDTYLGNKESPKEESGSSFGYHKPMLSLSGDVNVYRDPRTGEIKRVTVKNWASNVDFLGEYDFFSVLGDMGLGAVFGGYLAGSWDAELNYGGIDGNLIGTLARLRYDSDLSEDGTEATASLDYLKESLGNQNARLSVLEKRQDEFIIPNIGYNRYMGHKKNVKSGKTKDKPDDIWKAYT